MALRFLKLAGFALGAAAVGGLLLGERAAPLRKRTRQQAPRLARNVAMGVACQAVMMASEVPLTDAIAGRNARQQRGLQHRFGGMAGKMAAFLAMDYGFYLWHVATHKVPLLWRFHRVHHVDPDLDASTALRFHFLDMLVSLPWRLVQVRLSGIDLPTLKAWRVFFLFSVLFHHSNWKLPRGWDQKLNLVLTTPKMHGIHHSQNLSEMDSNWTSGISLWDRVHGTFRGDVAQDDLVIGVDDPAAERDVLIGPAHSAPFTLQHDRTQHPPLCR